LARFHASARELGHDELPAEASVLFVEAERAS
jgi:hypothetical protein